MKRTKTIGMMIAALALIAATGESQAQVRLPFLIGNGMVIQREADVPIWGWADPGTEVHVMFRDQNYTDVADSTGRWQVEVGSAHAGGPYEMRIAANDEMVTISDVLIGDVWICSGQSNMEWEVQNSNNAEMEIASANDPMIRHFKVPKSWSWEPQDKLAGGSWEAANPENVGSFTAVGYFFARELRKHVDVPIGLINTSWGGSRLEPWMNAATLNLTEADIDSIRTGVEEWEAEVERNLAAKIGDFPERDRGYEGDVAVWAAPDLDEAGWDTMPVPGAWEWNGYPGMDGTAWYRTSFELSADEAASGIKLGLGMIDDSDITWVNGVGVGGMEMAWNQVREYDVPASALKEGNNVLAVRVEDTGGGGGIQGDPSLLYVESNGRRQSLAGTWAFNVGLIDINLEGFNNQVPTLLYNKMIHPLLDYPITGALWYQGESNTAPADAYKYRDLFKDMIKQWRAEWAVGDFPFLYVQLANYMEAKDEPSESEWAVLRESQTRALDLDNTAQAVIIDIGEANDIHPRNKQDVGYRLSLAARHLEYGEADLVYSGPVPISMEFTGGKVYIDFDHVGDGLVLRDLPPGVSGFALAGDDKKFVWANAEIVDGRLVVSSGQVPNPVAVRYAWADNPVGANLYNSEGLPASPFRSDSW
jgi:sialate O-acetylesterase